MKLKYDRDNIFFRCVEDSSEAIMITGLDGKLVYVNPAWCRIYGYTYEEAIQNTPRLLHSGHHKKEFYLNMWEEISNPEIGHWRGEVINRTKSGEMVPVHLAITPYKDADGKVTGYMGMALDLSQRKELEARVAHQDRLASIGMLASGLAHEVGTPLGVIRGRAEFMGMQLENDSHKKSLEVIVSQIDRISKLISSLLRVSRSTSDLRVDDIVILDVVNEVSNLVEKDLKIANAELSVNVAPKITARADFSRLEQVILNFVMNALYAIKKAQEAGRTGGHRLAIEAFETKKNVILKVTDTGCGISPENLKKIFTPFFTTKAVGEGTGLGLAIVSQLVHEMGGKISVESKVDQGTTFTVVLKAF